MGALIKIWYLLVFFLIVTLSLYDNAYDRYISENKFSVKNYLNNPTKYGGYKDNYLANIINVSKDHFYLDLKGFNIKVFGSGIKKTVYGETVFFLNFRKDGRIELIDYHNYNYNYLLYFFSVIAFFIFIFIFFKEWKLTKKGFENA